MKTFSMIKIEHAQKCQSYWKGDSLYDNVRDKTYTIKLFGVTIWQSKERYDSDLTEHENKNSIGFKK